MKKVLLLFMLVVSLHSSAQITDQYDNPTLWTEKDDGLGNMSFVGNRLRWDINWGSSISTSNLRCSRSLNNLISSSANFRVAVTYKILTTLATGTTVLAITENDTPSFVRRLTATTFDCTQNSSITIVRTPGAYIIQIKPNGTTTLNNVTCNPIFEHVINDAQVVNIDRRIELTKNGNRYRFRVLNPTTGAELLNRIFCSTVTPSNLNFIQHGIHSTAGAFTGVLEVDSLSVDSAIVDPTINAYPNLTINGSRVLCSVDNQSITLTANSSTPNATIRWLNPAINSSTVSVITPGVYRAEVNLNQCSNIAEVNVVDSCSGCEDSCSWGKIGNRNVKAYNFIGTRNPADFKIRTSNVERMTVEADGNVGIGVNSPSEQLHTTNGVRFQGLTRLDTPSRVIVQDDNGKLFWRHASTLGTTGNFWNRNGNNNATSPPTVAIGTALPNTSNFIGTTTNHSFVLASNNLERMRIADNGNVGIGTINPTNRFQIGINPTTFNNNDFVVSNTDGSIAMHNHAGSSYLMGSNRLDIQAAGQGISITTAGNLGVGTTNPFTNTWSRTLEVHNSANSKITASSGGFNSPLRMEMYASTTPIWGIPNGVGAIGTQTNHTLAFVTNYIPRMYLSTNGNLGIGINNPTFQLQLGTNSAAKPGTSTWTISSDENLKNIDGKYLKGLKEIIALNPIQYNYKNTMDKKFDNSVLDEKFYGYSAQEVAKIFPEAVKEDNDGYLTLNIHPILIAYNNAIKELNAKVEKQNNAVIENEALKSELASVKEKLANYDEKFALLEKTITQLCESGCEGLKKTGEGSSSDVDVLYQSIPNPTDSEALINYSLSKEYTNAYISVSTQEGKQLMSVKLDAKKGAGAIKLSLGELASGTYLYTLVAGERVIDTKRLQIVK
jgi:hypothetical protein